MARRMMVDVPSLLSALRSQRMGLVQTEVCIPFRAYFVHSKLHSFLLQLQYKFLFTTLARVRREEGPRFEIKV